MAEEMQNQVEQVVPPTQPSAPQSAEETPKSGNRHMLLLFSVVLVFAIVLLAAGGYVYLSSNKNTANTQYSQALPTDKPTQTPTPTPLSSINEAGDLDSAFNEVNDTSDTDLQSDLDLANSESSNF